MKFFTKHLMFAFLASLLPTFAVTAQDTEVTQPAYYPGFFGHPFLSQDGWIATRGKFALSVGQSGAYHRDYSEKYDYITDTNPYNTSSEFSLADITPGYAELIRIVVDPKFEGEVEPIPIGSRIGFAMRQGGSNVSVVDLDLISMSAINLLDKDDKVIKSVYPKDDEQFNVLNLGVINLSSGESVQKVIAKVSSGDPDLVDADGNSKVYGFALSYQGVKLDVAKNAQILYAFMDDYIEVPIIKKHYPFATAKSSGMTSGARNLVDNKLDNGASTAILNIGGAYYDVKVNEYYTHDYTDALGDHKRGQPVLFPKGVEAGWVISGGQALTLDIGQSFKLRGIKPDGKYVDISSSTSVIGGSLLGGGTQRLTFITPTDVDLVGFRLENVKGISLELGATIYNYAYIKVPTYEDFIPKRNIPYNAIVEAIPSSTTSFSNGKITNTYQNDIRVANDPEKPLQIPGQTSGTNTWHDYDAWFAGALNLNRKIVQMGLTRKAIYSDGSEGNDVSLGRFDVLWSGTGVWGSGFKNNTVYWRYKKTPTTSSDFKKDQTCSVYDIKDENGNVIFKDAIDFSPLLRADDALKEEIKADNNVVAYEYGLYYLNEKQEALNIDNYAEECLPLGYSYVTIPDYQPEFEMAGTVDYIDVNNNTLTTVSTAKTESTEVTGEEVAAGTVIDSDRYHHYVSFEIPDKTDEKTTIKSVTLYRYNNSVHEAVDTYVWDGSTWNGQKGDTYKLGYAKVAELGDNYHHKVVALVDDPSDNYEYGLGYTLQLAPEYQTMLQETFKVSYPSRNLNYEWYKGTKHPYDIPVLTHSESVPTAGQDGAVTVTSYWNLTLESAKEIHEAQTDNDVEKADWLDNVDILYNQWTTLDTKENVNARSMVRAYDAEADAEPTPTPEFPMTDLTVNFNTAIDANNSDFIDAADANTVYLTAEEDGDHLLTSQVTYTSDVAGKNILYNATARAYIPVVPYGFQNIVTDDNDGSEGLSNSIQTYIVAEATMEEPIELYAVPTGVEDLTADKAEYDEEAEYYNTLGVKVVNPGTGIYIVRRGNTVTKEMIVR